MLLTIGAGQGAVEVVFDTGHIARDTIEHEDDGRFMLIGDDAQAACELRLFNHVGKLEHQLPLEECGPATSR